MPQAIIVAHGQPSDPDPAEASLARFAAQVDVLTQEVSVHSATLAAPSRLEAVMDELPSDAVIYPLFMAKGWFVTSALPKRVGNRGLRVLDPLGVDPELPTLVCTALREALTSKDWVTEDTDLVIAAHGSGRSRNPSAVTLEFAETLGGLLPFRTLNVGFVEEPPSIADAASSAGAQSLCLPFFACTGGHVLEDVPQELNRVGFQGATLPVVGELPPIQRQIARKLDAAFAAA